MSSTPPPTSNQAVADNPAGDGVEISVDAARSGERTGRVVWILMISLGALVIVFAIFLIAHARRFQATHNPSQRDLNTADAASFNTPPPQPRQTPTASSGGGNAQ